MPNAHLNPAILAQWEAKRHANLLKACYVCGRRKCKLATHRRVEPGLLRSLFGEALDDHNQDSESSTTAESGSDKSLAMSAHQKIVYRPQTPYSTSDLHGVPQPIAKYFHAFLTGQGRDIRVPDRGLYFNIDAYPYLFPVAMRHPALLATYAAQGATFAALHGRQLTAPDPELFSMYNYCIRALGQQVEKEYAAESQVSELSMLAAINLTECCGFAFGDSETTLTHWNGVKTLYYSSNHLLYSGALTAYFEALEYMVLLCTGVSSSTPDQPQWRTVVTPPKQVHIPYGAAFPDLSQHPLLESPCTSKLLETCLNTCRATTELEEQTRMFLSQRKKPPNAYYDHLRAVLVKQNTTVYATLYRTNSLAECIALTVNIFYCCVLRMMPFHAPLLHLCHRLRELMLSSGCFADTSKLVFSTDDTIQIQLPDRDENDLLLRDLYLWVLFVYACASRLCRDHLSQDWGSLRIQEMAVTSLVGESATWQQNVAARLRRFCWSDLHLARAFQDVCSTVELVDQYWVDESVPDASLVPVPGVGYGSVVGLPVDPEVAGDGLYPATDVQWYTNYETLL